MTWLQKCLGAGRCDGGGSFRWSSKWRKRSTLRQLNGFGHNFGGAWCCCGWSCARNDSHHLDGICLREWNRYDVGRFFNDNRWGTRCWNHCYRRSNGLIRVSGSGEFLRHRRCWLVWHNLYSRQTNRHCNIGYFVIFLIVILYCWMMTRNTCCTCAKRMRQLWQMC